MRKMTLIVCVLIIVFLVGCWDYREINDMEIVSGFAIDKEKDKYVLTVDKVMPSKTESPCPKSKVDVDEGDTMLDAVRNIISKTGKRLYWSHAKVIIISEELAREGLIPVIDFISRDIEARADMWIIISREKTAGEILKTKCETESTISTIIDNALTNEDKVHTYHGVKIWRFIKDIEEEGKSPVLSSIKNIIRNGETYTQMYGIGVFKEDKLVGWLNDEQTKYYLFVIDKIKGGIIPLKNVSNTGTNVSIEIFDSKTRLEPEIKEGKLIINVFVETDADISEVMGSEDFISEKGRNILIKEGEKFIENKIFTVIEKVQKEYKSDIFGFCSIFHRKYPSEWKKIKSDWDEIFADLDVNVDVTLNIKASAISNTTIKRKGR